MKTSLKLSQWLKERGFEEKTDSYTVFENLKGTGVWIPLVCWDGTKDPDCNYLNRYDILNDLCVKYAKEIWGEKVLCSICGCELEKQPDDRPFDYYDCRKCDDIWGYSQQSSVGYHTGLILGWLQENTPAPAELHIMKHSILNQNKNA